MEFLILIGTIFGAAWVLDQIFGSGGASSTNSSSTTIPASIAATPSQAYQPRHLGTGAFASVQSTIYQGKERAVKLCASAAEAQAEFAILRQFNHPHIVRTYGVQGTQLYLELLQASLAEVRISSIAHFFRYLKDGTKALVALHALGWYHTDIKPANLVISSDGTRIVLIDFQHATKDTRQVFTPLYAPPGAAKGQRATPHDDLYSLAKALLDASTITIPPGTTTDTLLQAMLTNRSITTAHVLHAITAIMASATTTSGGTWRPNDFPRT